MMLGLLGIVEAGLFRGQMAFLLST